MKIDNDVMKDMQECEPRIQLSDGSKTIPQVQIDSLESLPETENLENSDYASVQSDGWQPEAAKKKDARCRKKQTKVITTGVGTLSVKTVSLKKRIPRTRKHLCQLCGDEFEMQSEFTKHIKEKHPLDKFQYEFCQKSLDTSNRLFKHQRSHLYLKHGCDYCDKHLQFPGQKTKHMQIHTKTGLYRCLHCPKEYTTNSSMLEHAACHTTSLQCKLCPKSTEKRYNSKYGLAQHTRGMHGGGWTAPCSENFKWKSKYNRHLSRLCLDCKTYLKCKKKQRYLFTQDSTECKNDT